MSGKYVPGVTRNPVRLAISLLLSGDASARSALWMTAAGILCWPLDQVLSIFESRRLANAACSQRPALIVCGPPRSGTTLVAQYLINSLDVAYLNNLTSVFPSAPLTVNSIWGKKSIRGGDEYTAFYGKSRGFRGANDGLYIWDRWLGPDRTMIPDALTDCATRDLPAFFGELERIYDRPIVNKINRLNSCAHLVAPLLPNAIFLFVNREPLWLAQSLYVARQRISGDLGVAYGTQHPNAIPDDPVADVCEQVRFHQRRTEEIVDQIPDHQVVRVDYEKFCANPRALIEMLALRLGERMPDSRAGRSNTRDSFTVSQKEKLPADVLDRMRVLLAD